MSLDLKTFWLVLTIASLAWYVFVTLYVGWRGFADIRHMLARLSRRHESELPDNDR